MPSYWIMNDVYSKEMDNFISSLLDKYDFEKITNYTAMLGKTEIWIGNQPYSCMMPYDLKCTYQNVRPSRLTIKRGLKKLKKAKEKSLKIYLDKLASECIEKNS